jgi:hypothetical protein
MTAARTFAKFALPVVAAGVLGGVALGLAGMASAGTYSYQPEPRPGIVATPNTIARPPVIVLPRHHGHQGGGGFVIDLGSGE